ncbi:MAG: hypothetical protein ACI4MP_00375 [Candidatus Ventricola sp.]
MHPPETDDGCDPSYATNFSIEGRWMQGCDAGIGHESDAKDRKTRIRVRKNLKTKKKSLVFPATAGKTGFILVGVARFEFAGAFPAVSFAVSTAPEKHSNS